MLISEARRIISDSALSQTRRVGLLCSFEPLHLKTYLQAFLCRRYPEAAPEVVSFGYDQLHQALLKSTQTFQHHPTLLLLSWEDLHPGLSWRTRRPFAPIEQTELTERSSALREAFQKWIDGRPQAETFVMLPPQQWLPLLDAQSPDTLSLTMLFAQQMLHDLVAQLAQRGARIMPAEQTDLNMRDLLLAGHPFTVEASQAVAERFVEMAFQSASRKKVLVLDLDDTLWHGVIGEDGADQVTCRPEGVGYPFFVFQSFLKKLRAEGVMLALCTKNNESDVLPVFNSMDMPLKLEDFSAIQCSWESKYLLITQVCQQLNVLPDSVVYVDDNEAELAEIRVRLADVTCLHTPSNSNEWLPLLRKLQSLFATWNVREEDRLRSNGIGLRNRDAQAIAGDPNARSSSLAHLRELGLRIMIQHEAFADGRSLELLNKTNQFNLTGERLAPDQWLAWKSTPGSFCVSIRLADRYGDFGTIGVATGSVEPTGTVQLRNMVLSCRAFGRGVEYILLNEAARHSRSGMIQGPFIDTSKNAPALVFLQTLGCNPEPNTYWSCTTNMIRDKTLTIRDETAMIEMD